MAEIVFEKICKSFGNTKVIENLDLRIADGSFTVLVGASGCGKTTLLRIIAGIGPQSCGKLYINDLDVTDLPAGKRNIAMVFQNYAIYPTMSVRGNIEFGLRNNKVPKSERDRLVNDVAETVGLSPYLNRKPNELSGGQRQRIALARALVKTPDVFLLDEPLSNLDAKLRVSMRSELIELHHKLQSTFVYVTHDQSGAMAMADTIILMDKGKIMQMAAPEVIYLDPDNVFTAQFIGTPPMNILKLSNGFFGYRPESIQLSYNRQECNAVYQISGIILTREMMGSETIYKVRLSSGAEAGQTVMVKSNNYRFHLDDNVFLTVPNELLYFFSPDEQRIRPQSDAALQALLSQIKAVI